MYHPRAIMSIGKYRNCHLTSAGAWGINKINRSKNRDNFTLQSFHIQASGTGSQMEQDTTRTAVYRCTQSRIQIVSSARKVVGLRSKYVRRVWGSRGQYSERDADAIRDPNASRMAEIKMTSRVLELDNQINELRQRAQAEPGNTALRLQLDVLAQEQIEALFESSREVMEHVDAALRICRKTRAEIGATQAMLARREYLESQNETDGEQ